MENALYHVGLKIMLNKNGRFLFLNDADGGHFDWPGGRINISEKYTPLEDIIKREVGEELGEDIKYKLGKPLFQYRRHLENRNLHILVTVYEATYLSGEINLSSEHSKYQWVDPKDFQFTEKDFFHHEEFLAFQKYFNGLK